MKSEKSIGDTFIKKKMNLDACCIIPAAGNSSRMGLWKGDLFVPTDPGSSMKQISMIKKAVDCAFNSCRRVILVGGEQMPRIKKLFALNADLILVENKAYEKGMLSSVQAGMKFVDTDFFIMPMDMPLLTPSHLFKIHNEFCNKKMPLIFRPVFKDRPGHPVFVPYSWKERILKMEGGNFKNNISLEDQVLIPWDNESVVLDLDTKLSYEKFIRNYSRTFD